MNEFNAATRILTREELKARLGSNPQRIYIDNSEVPDGLHVLIPYAEIWGISDDWAREELVQNTPQLVKENLQYVIAQFEDELDAWLAGPEALNSDPTNAYIAFSAFRMAVDFI